MYHRVLFIGSKESGYNVFKTMFKVSPETLVGCVTLDDSDDTRSYKDHFIEFCDSNKIALNILRGKSDLSESIDRYKPDICIVMGWYHIISPRILDLVHGGFVGIHNSLLPRHRGFAPVVWSIIAGDNQTGFSVFSLDAGMDTGNLWYQEAIEINKSDYVEDIIAKLNRRIELFFRNKYIRILDGTLVPYRQTEEFVSYGARRLPDDGKIDWSLRAERIYDSIRAQSKPYPGAFTVYRGSKVTLWKSDVFMYPIQGRPGQIGIIDKNKGMVVIVCGENSGLIVTEVEINGDVVKSTDLICSLNYDVGV